MKLENTDNTEWSEEIKKMAIESEAAAARDAALLQTEDKHPPWKAFLTPNSIFAMVLMFSCFCLPNIDKDLEFLSIPCFICIVFSIIILLREFAKSDDLYYNDCHQAGEDAYQKVMQKYESQKE